MKSHSVPKITIIWCMFPEIWNMADIIFCCFGPFCATLLTPKIKLWNKFLKTWKYYPITHVYHKRRSYDVWFLRYKAWHIFLSFWVIFCSLTLLTTWKMKISTKWKITPGEIIILHKFTKTPDHMLYCVPEIWCMTDIIIFHFGLFFALLPL